MPIYEFYCPDCNTLFNFFSSTIDTAARPACPRCGRAELERRPARFATLRAGGGKSEEGDDEETPAPFAGMDESRMEGAMESLAQEMEGLSDAEAENPRQMARFFRRFGQMSGLEPGPRMEEMLRRLEAGEDPDALEDDMGEGLDDEQGFAEFFRLKKQAQARRARRPKVDETLYFL